MGVLHHHHHHLHQRQNSNLSVQNNETISVIKENLATLDALAQKLELTGRELRHVSNTKPTDSGGSAQSFKSLSINPSRDVPSTSHYVSGSPSISRTSTIGAQNQSTISSGSPIPSVSSSVTERTASSALDVAALPDQATQLDSHNENRQEKKAKKSLFRIPGFRLGWRGKEQDVQEENNGEEGKDGLAEPPKPPSVLEKSLSFTLGDASSRKAGVGKSSLRKRHGLKVNIHGHNIFTCS
jgi:hypothetical protein